MLLQRVVAVLNDMGRRGMQLGQAAYVDLMHLSAVSADPARALQMFAGMSAVQQVVSPALLIFQILL